MFPILWRSRPPVDRRRAPAQRKQRGHSGHQCAQAGTLYGADSVVSETIALSLVGQAIAPAKLRSIALRLQIIADDVPWRLGGRVVEGSLQTLLQALGLSPRRFLPTLTRSTVAKSKPWERSASGLARRSPGNCRLAVSVHGEYLSTLRSHRINSSPVAPASVPAFVPAGTEAGATLKTIWT